MADLRRGDPVEFSPSSPRAAKRRGVVEAVPPVTGEALVLLEGDPFPVMVNLSQLTCVQKGKSVKSPTQQTKGNKARKIGKERQLSTTSKPNAKQLRKDAQALGIEGWEGMGKKELAEAVKAAQSNAKKAPAKKAASKKAPAKKAASKKAPAKKAASKKEAPKEKAERKKPGPKPREVAPGENPYRKGSNLHSCFTILKVGGKRRTMAEKLARKVEIVPHTRPGATKPEDYDKRLILASQDLEKRFGWTVVRTGRGLDGSLRIFPPGTKPPASKKVPASKKAPAKKAPAKKAAPKRGSKTR